MRARHFALVAFGLFAGCASPQPQASAPVPKPWTPPSASVSAAAAVAVVAPVEPLVVSGEVQRMLSRFAAFPLEFDDSKLTVENKTVIKKAVEASMLMHELFMYQMDAGLGELRARLESDPSKAAALRLFNIMSGPWDELNHDEPFIGTAKRLPGANFYPSDMTKDEFNAFVEKNPGQKDAFQNYFTVIARKDGKLTSVPYSEAYKRWLEPAAARLREAAIASKEPTLKNFLQLRAAAFESNDYRPSDKAWMDVKGDLEITIGPYETYADQIFQYKASYEAFVAIRDIEESRKLEVIGRQMEALERNLPLDAKHKADASTRAKGSPIDVVQLLCNAGQAGVQTVAYNLPNDEAVRAEKGSKKVMLKNILQGKFEHIVKPIAARVVAEDQLPLLNAEAIFNYILMHEVAHGLGPGIITVNGTKTEVNKAMKELYGGLEEAKADITGLVGAQYLIEQKIYPKNLEKEIYVAYLSTAFRQMRFGVKEAHGRGVVASVNYLMKKGGIVHNPKTGRFNIDFKKIKAAVRSLAHEYLTLEAEGNYDGAKKFFEQYAVVTPELQAAIDRIGGDIPVDIAPVFPVTDKMRSW